MRVVGLDLSLTSCGVAVVSRRVDGTTLATCASFTSKGKRADSVADRARRIATLASEVTTGLANPDLVVVEGQSHGSRGGSIVDRAGLWWRVIDGLVARSVPVAVCPPKTRAKAMTGNGSADKAAVSAAVKGLWPDLQIDNGDESDALSLAHLGAVCLGWAVPTLQRHRDALRAIEWPELPAVTASG